MILTKISILALFLVSIFCKIDKQPYITFRNQNEPYDVIIYRIEHTEKIPLRPDISHSDTIHIRSRGYTLLGMNVEKKGGRSLFGKPKMYIFELIVHDWTTYNRNERRGDEVR